MPKATPSSSKATAPATGEPAPIPGAPRYATRGKTYRYSHTKPPFVPPPPPPRERPALPPSAARKHATRTATEPATSHSTPEESDMMAEAQHGNYDNRTPAMAAEPQAGDGLPSPSQLIRELPLASEEEGMMSAVTSQQAAPTFSAWNQGPGNGPPAASEGFLGHHGTLPGATQMPGAVLCTPRRPNHPVSFTTPAVVILGAGTPPSWARFDNFGSSPEIAPFLLNTQPRASTFQSTSLASDDVFQDTTRTQNLPHHYEQPPAHHLPLAEGLECNTQQSMAHSQQFQLNQSQGNAPASSFAALQSAIVQLLPPGTVIGQQLPTSSTLANSAPTLPHLPDNHAREDMTMHPLWRAQSLSTVRSNSFGSDGSGSRESSVAPSVARSSSTRHSTPFESSQQGPHRAQKSLRQADFTHEQGGVIRCMRRRWHFYLATEDPFPMSVLAAQRAWILYTEEVLGVPRTALPISHSLLEHVRRKDSNIRNSFLDNLLKTVEESYGVNANTTTKLEELIKNLNFIYTGFDYTTKKVTGRYRHPCIALVIKALLFAKRARTQSIGVRFIRELMADTPLAACQEFHDPTANSGAPVPTLALSCTLILYALQSIQAGDSSARSPKAHKPISFGEDTYGGHYRSILAKLKQYPRLGELRKAHMEEIMKEYIQIQASTVGQAHVEIDDEMVSDGE